MTEHSSLLIHKKAHYSRRYGRAPDRSVLPHDDPQRRLQFMVRRSLIVVLVLCAFGLAPCFAQDNWQRQADRLSALLHWQEGASVAEIGAGDGELTLLAAQRVGPSGKVYSTELDTQKLAALEELAKKNGNIQVIKAG